MSVLSEETLKLFPACSTRLSKDANFDSAASKLPSDTFLGHVWSLNVTHEHHKSHPGIMTASPGRIPLPGSVS